jgi:hypothetical protein
LGNNIAADAGWRALGYRIRELLKWIAGANGGEHQDGGEEEFFHKLRVSKRRLFE